MIGVQDFIRYYDWTFEYIRLHYSEEEVRRYWGEAIAFNSQNHAYLLIKEKGLAGMAEYWGHSLDSEEAGYVNTLTSEYFRIDMHNCPSKGFLIEIEQEEYHDYCQHCMGWIKPIMDETGFVIDHEHNHRGKCWWEMKPATANKENPKPPPIRGYHDVRRREDWQQEMHDLWLDSRRADQRHKKENEA
jgi:hypothetical protein